ncbi:MAG: 4-hydroxythreonine-4-phosphate dehydrogenase PdxA [Bacteroidota bacterium]
MLPFPRKRIRRDRPIIGLTIGDINGIGPEVLLKGMADKRLQRFVIPVIIGPMSALHTHAGTLKVKNLNLHPIRSIEEIDSSLPGKQTGLYVLDQDDDETPAVEFGRPTEASGRTAMKAVDEAIRLSLDESIAGFVTAPISKEAVVRAGYNIPGHTEHIAAKTHSQRYTMMMVAQSLRVGLVTTHHALRDIPVRITEEAILEKLDIIDESLQLDFGIDEPRIAVLSLNPHAGDGGVLGREEIEIIQPALQKAAARGLQADGPHAADGFFANRRFNDYDAILAMYHDQGLIPFKALSFNSGINFTAGLPIIRTSPDHGTAYDIAGQGKASPESIRHALYLALDIARRRRAVGVLRARV